jgi:hypothetical protein
MVGADHSISTQVYRVEVELEREDGSRTRDFGKWIVAHDAAEAEALALESATARWPLYKPLGVTFVGIDHSRRAQGFLKRQVRTEGLPTPNAASAPETDDQEVPTSRSPMGEPDTLRTGPDVLDDLALEPRVEESSTGRLGRLEARRLQIVELLMRQTR